MNTEQYNEIQIRIKKSQQVAQFLGWQINGTEITIPFELYVPYNIHEFETGNYDCTWDAFDLLNNINWNVLHYIITKIVEKNIINNEYNEIINFPITIDFITAKEKVINYILNL